MKRPRILGVGTATPPNRFSQEELLEMSGYRDPLRRSFFLNSGIRFRHLCIDRDFTPTETVDQLNERSRKGGIEAGREAILRCLQKAGASPQDVDFIGTTTCTVSLCPSLDAIFIRELGMKRSIQRAHIGDTGCASAMVALQQACNHLRAYPAHKALVVAVEICSSAYTLDDAIETAVGNAIFADGAAAVFLAASKDGVEVLGHRTVIRPEYLELMGFAFPGGRRRLVLSKDIRQVAASMLKELVEGLLEEHQLDQKDIRFWVLHSAGRKVVENVKTLMGLREQDLAFSRMVLREYGNVSSATILFVLEKVMELGQPQPGDLGVMAALGPGFAAEGALLRW